MSVPDPVREAAKAPLPCPFCGSPGRMLKPSRESDPRGFRVICPWGGCNSKARSETREGAVAAWNRRAALAAPEPREPTDEEVEDELVYLRGWQTRALACWGYAPHNIAGVNADAMATERQLLADSDWPAVRAVRVRAAGLRRQFRDVVECGEKLRTQSPSELMADQTLLRVLAERRITERKP